MGEADRVATVAWLLDQQQIRDCLMRYSRGVDRGDVDLVRTCFHPDAIDDHGAATPWGTTVMGPVENLFKLLEVSPKRWPMSRHVISNVLIEISEDKAHSESYCQAWQWRREGGRVLERVMHLRYIDRFERRDGTWLIAHRVVAVDWATVNENKAEADVGQRLRGRRDREDAVFRLRQEWLDP